ncbi:hypothetical protein KNE206_57380 [Kitasatospora sp. NE20-6]
MPEKPKKVAGLSVTPAARRAAAAARAQAARQQRGADVFGGDVEELVNRSFVGQGIQAAAADSLPSARISPPTAAAAPIPPAVPAHPSADAQPVSSAPDGSADPLSPSVNPWLASRAVPAAVTAAEPQRPAAPPTAETDSRLTPAAPAVADAPLRPTTAATAQSPSRGEQPEVATGSPGLEAVTPGVNRTADGGSVAVRATPDGSGGEAETPAAAAAVTAPAGAPAGIEHTAQESAPGPAADTTAAAPQPASGSGRQRKPGVRRGASGVTRQAVLTSWTESTMDLKLGKNQWRTLPFRFAPDLVAALSARVGQDRETSGRQLTIAQYVDAAMRLYLPSDTSAQLALAEELFIRREGDVPAGRQASHRVSPAVYDVASRLPNDLRSVGRARTGVHVYSAALDLFLTALNDEGPLA